MTYAIIAFLVALAVVHFGRIELKKRWRNYRVPAPHHKRSDILFGYYGSYGDTASIDHTSLFWCVPHWEGIEKAIADMRRAGKPTVLDLQTELFYRVPGEMKMTPHVEHEQVYRLRVLFARLRSAGVLQLVEVLYPIDEPNLPEHKVDVYMPAAIAMVRRIASEFEELDGVKIGVIYYARTPMQHVELYDILGFDDYDNESGILRPGEMYDQLVKRLRPDQRTWLVPGGTYGQDPEPFINFALGRPEVWAVIPFIYRVPPWETEFRGIADRPHLAEVYAAAGRSLKETA